MKWTRQTSSLILSHCDILALQIILSYDIHLFQIILYRDILSVYNYRGSRRIIYHCDAVSVMWACQSLVKYFTHTVAPPIIFNKVAIAVPFLTNQLVVLSKARRIIIEHSILKRRFTNRWSRMWNVHPINLPQHKIYCIPPSWYVLRFCIPMADYSIKLSLQRSHLSFCLLYHFVILITFSSQFSWDYDSVEFIILSQ